MCVSCSTARPPFACTVLLLRDRLRDQAVYCDAGPGRVLAVAFGELLLLAAANLLATGWLPCRAVDGPDTAALLSPVPWSSLVVLLVALLATRWVTSFAVPGATSSRRATVVPGSPRPPDLLLVFVDDLNADFSRPWAKHLPNLRAFASRPGTTAFAEAYAQVPVCAPSRTSTLFGLSATQTGLRRKCQCFHAQFYLGSDVPTLPRVLRQAGYRTFGGGKIFSSDARLQSADWTAYWPSLTRFSPDWAPNCTRWQRTPWFRDDFARGEWTCPVAQHRDAQLASWAASTLIASRDATAPVLVAVGLRASHLPWVSPQEAWDAARQALRHAAANATADRYVPGEVVTPVRLSRWATGYDAAKGRFGSKPFHDLALSYAAACAFLDRQLGRVLAAADAVPRPRVTVVLSDHGFLMSEKKSFKKYLPWRPSARAPLLIHDSRLAVPASAHARIHQLPVSLLDVFPTVLDATGLEVDTSWLSGSSLWPIVTATGPSAAASATVVHAKHPGVAASYTVQGSTVELGQGTSALCFDATDEHQHNAWPQCTPAALQRHRSAMRRTMGSNCVQPRVILVLCSVANLIAWVCTCFLWLTVCRRRKRGRRNKKRPTVGA